MGRNKFSQREIDIIRKLLNRKVASNRGGQKMVRHTLRTVFNFNISDFNVQGQPQETALLFRWFLCTLMGNDRDFGG